MVPTKGGGFKFRPETNNLQNFILLWGEKPGSSVIWDTKMVKELIEKLEAGIDKNTLSNQFPKVFEQLRGEDASFELVISTLTQYC